MNENKIYLNYLGESSVLRTALVGGFTDDDDKPITMFGGKLDLDEVLLSLVYINRAVLKILSNEFDLKLDEGLEVLTKVLKESFMQELQSVVNDQNDVSMKTIVKSIRTDN